jgi:hypothetical protein
MNEFLKFFKLGYLKKFGYIIYTFSSIFVFRAVFEAMIFPLSSVLVSSL